jgi:hypothetical protein
VIEEAAPNVDWSTLQINEINDEYEGRIEYIDDDHVFELLGLGDEQDKAREDAGAATDMGKGPDQNTEGAALPVDDSITGERVIVYDPDKPCMNIGSVYPNIKKFTNMKEFGLAMRQFAINEEFELNIDKTDPSRFIGNCMVEDCPWHIVGRRQPDQKTTMVLTLYLTMAYAFVHNNFYWQLTISFHLQVTILMDKHT